MTRPRPSLPCREARHRIDAAATSLPSKAHHHPQSSLSAPMLGSSSSPARNWCRPSLRCTGRMVASATDAGVHALRSFRKAAHLMSRIIACSAVRVLPAPPRSPAKLRFPGAVGIVFNIPRLCRWRPGIARSLSPGIGKCRQKCRPGLWPRQTLSRRNSRSRTETGSNVGRDRFESSDAAQARWGLIPPDPALMHDVRG